VEGLLPGNSNLASPLNLKNLESLKGYTPLSDGNVGSMIRQLWLPSWDEHMDLLQFVVPYMVHVKEYTLLTRIRFHHPCCELDFVPTLHPSLIIQTVDILATATHISIDDVDELGWRVLIDNITLYSKRLKVLKLDCCTDTYPFTSSKGLGEMFCALPGLECIRLDSAPIGTGELGEKMNQMTVRGFEAFLKHCKIKQLDFHW
jgi:hypothetical protein